MITTILSQKQNYTCYLPFVFKKKILNFNLNLMKFNELIHVILNLPVSPLYLAITVAFIITWYMKFWPGEGTSRTAPHSTPHLTPNYCLTLGASTEISKINILPYMCCKMYVICDCVVKIFNRVGTFKHFWEILTPSKSKKV